MCTSDSVRLRVGFPQSDGTLRYIDVLHHLTSSKLNLESFVSSPRTVSVLSRLAFEFREAGGTRCWWRSLSWLLLTPERSLALVYAPPEFRYRQYYAARILQVKFLGVIRRNLIVQARNQGLWTKLLHTHYAANSRLADIRADREKLRIFDRLHLQYWQELCLRIESQAKLHRLELQVTELHANRMLASDSCLSASLPQPLTLEKAAIQVGATQLGTASSETIIHGNGMHTAMRVGSYIESDDASAFSHNASVRTVAGSARYRVPWRRLSDDPDGIRTQSPVQLQQQSSAVRFDAVALTGFGLFSYDDTSDCHSVVSDFSRNSPRQEPEPYESGPNLYSLHAFPAMFLMMFLAASLELMYGLQRKTTSTCQQVHSLRRPNSVPRQMTGTILLYRSVFARITT